MCRGCELRLADIEELIGVEWGTRSVVLDLSEEVALGSLGGVYGSGRMGAGWGHVRAGGRPSAMPTS